MANAFQERRGGELRIEFEGVGKSFRRDDGGRSLRALWGSTAARLFGGPAPPVRPDFHALKDVNFEVRSGECVGVIGHNGAGKSTVLKCASRIFRPNTGRVDVRGRVSALIEVGAGFHPRRLRSDDRPQLGARQRLDGKCRA